MLLHNRLGRAIVLGCLTMAAATGMQGAQAAPLSGTIAAGPGVGSGGCGTTAECLSWTRVCGTPQTNDLDASVRSTANNTGRVIPFSWSAAAGDAGNAIVIETYSANCSRTSVFSSNAKGGTVILPAEGAWVVVMAKFPFAQFHWSLG